MTEALEQEMEESRKRLLAVENLKETEMQIAELTERLGESLSNLTRRLENKKIELTGLAEFMIQLDTKADEIDRLETEILGLLKKKLAAV